MNRYKWPSFQKQDFFTLKKGDKVVISSFGTFYVGKVKDKHVEPFGEKTKRQVVKAHRVVHFRVGKPLKRAVV